MLLNLMSDVERLESASTVSKLVSHELESAFHPTCLFVWYREAASQHLTLSYSSGGYIHTAQLGPQAPLGDARGTGKRRDRGSARRQRTRCRAPIATGSTKRASA